MELHEAIRELVDAHGVSMFSDAGGFRGVLDDVLEEDQATTGDINLLVDAVRFDAVTPLSAMIDGGADPTRAVEEAGQRLARDRGGADHIAASWAAAVLGYAVGKVPVDVVRRFGALRPPSSQLPNAAPPSGPSYPAAPMQPPPGTVWPQQPSPTILPGRQSAPQSVQPGPQGPSGGYPSGPGYGPGPGFVGAPAKRRSPVGWIAAAVVAVLVVAGSVTGIVLATGGGDEPDKKTNEPTEPKVDVDPAAIDERYGALATSITSGAGECTAAEPGNGQVEVVDCTFDTGTARLITFEADAAMTTARAARLDYRSGTLTADNGTTALYEYDPDRGGTSDPAVVYWDSKAALQSVTLTGSPGTTIDELTEAYKATTPRVAEPTGPTHPSLRDFIDINLKVAKCTRQRTFFVNETEESSCDTSTTGVVVNVGRFTTRKGMKDQRKYYKGRYQDAGTRGGSPTWRFGEGDTEGAYFAYVDGAGDTDTETATLYWDWDTSDCYCYGVAWNFEGDLAAVENWWPSDD